MNFSVAICTYNGGKYLREQLDSILSQSLPVEEIIVCDDLSTDSTFSILQEYKSKYPALFTIHVSEKSLGVVKNFEKAINLCTKEIILLSDQDDIWFSEKTQKIHNYFECNPDKNAVLHNLKLLKDSNSQNFTIWDFLLFTENERIKNNQQLITYAFVVDNFVTGAALAFRNKEKLSLTKDINMYHDFQIFLKFALTESFGILNESLGYYRIHDEQKVGANTAESDYIKTRKNRYLHGDSFTKLDLLESVIILNRKNAQNLSSLLEVNHHIQNELNETKKEILESKTFFQRKRILYSWFRKEKYNTKFTDVLFS